VIDKKARDELGYKSEVTIEEGLKEMEEDWKLQNESK